MRKEDLFAIIFDIEADDEEDEDFDDPSRAHREVETDRLRLLRRTLESLPFGSSAAAAEVYLAVEHEGIAGNDGDWDEDYDDLIGGMMPSYKQEVLSELARRADPNVLLDNGINSFESHMGPDSWNDEEIRKITARLKDKYATIALHATASHGLLTEADALLEKGVDTTGVMEAVLKTAAIRSKADEIDPRVTFAEKMFARGAHFTEPEIITSIVSAGSSTLLAGWMDQYRENESFESLLTEALYVAASQKKGEYVDQLVKAGAKPLLAKHGRKIVSMLAREHRNDALWYMIDHGVVFDQNHPMHNLRAIKCTALDMPVSERNEKIFDAMAELLRQQKTLQGTIPYPEYFSEADVVNQSDDYKDFVGFAKVVGIAHRIAQQVDPAHMSRPKRGTVPTAGEEAMTDTAPADTAAAPPVVISPLFASLTANCLHAKRNKATFRWDRELQAGSMKDIHPEEAKDVGDCLRYMTKVLLMPTLLCHAKNPETVDLHKCVEMLMPKLAPHVIADRSIPVVIGLANRFSHAHTHLGALRISPRDAQWPALTEDWKDQSGYYVTFLTTPQELMDEGGTQHHCVGTMDDACLYSNHHVASIRRFDAEKGKTEVLATALLSLDDHNRLRVSDYRLEDNVRVTAGTLAAGIMERFLLAFQLGEAKLNSKVQSFAKQAARSRAGRGENYEAWLGFDPLERPPRSKEIQTWVSDTQVEREWKSIEPTTFMHTMLEHVRISDHSILPGGRRKWRDMTTDDFLNETGLMEEIKTLAANPPRRGGRGRANGGNQRHDAGNGNY